tara:strand:- start:8691 stop:10985 length:2295 start_codon:yes stop_codon:yes gene_type:complete
MKTFLRTLISWQLQHPKLVLSLLFLMTCLLLIPMSNLNFNFSIEQLYSKDDPKVAEYFGFIEEFEREDNLIYLIYKCSDPFSYDNLHIAEKLQENFERIEGIVDVVCLTNIELFEESENLVLSEVYENIPEEEDSLSLLKKRILNTPYLVDNLVKNSKGLASFVLSIDDNFNQHDNRERILNEVEIIQNSADWEWHNSGIPVLRTRYIQYMLEDYTKFFIPVTFIIILVLLYLFRTVRGVLIPILTVHIADILALGFMSLIGFEVNIVTYIVPTLVLIVGVSDAIHILVKFNEELLHTSDKVEAIKKTMEKVGAAILLTSITTAVGFMSLMSTNILIIQQFGFIIGVAVILTFICSVIFIPCVLVLLKNPPEVQIKRMRFSTTGKFIGFVVSMSRQYPIKIMAIFSIILIFSIFYSTKLDTNAALLDDVTGTPLYDEMKFMEEEMGSVLPLEIIIEVMENGERVQNGIKAPEVLKKIEELQIMISTIPEIGNSISMVDYLKEMNRAFHGGEQDFYKIPKSQELVAQYLLLNEEEFEHLVDYNYSLTRISARIKDVPSAKAQEISESIESWVQIHFPENINVDVTGTTLMALRTNKYLVINLIQSFLIAFGVIFVLIILLFRSLRLALLSMIPNIMPLLIMAGIMGFFQIKLRPTTAMTFAIAFGIAVDDTIHYISRFRQELRQSNNRYKIANEKTLFTTGYAITSTSIILILGFLVLVISNFNPSRDYGFLSAVTIFSALVGDLFLFPAIIGLVKPKIPTKQKE